MSSPNHSPVIFVDINLRHGITQSLSLLVSCNLMASLFIDYIKYVSLIFVYVYTLNKKAHRTYQNNKQIFYIVQLLSRVRPTMSCRHKSEFNSVT